jgi:hypothetical protein
MTTEVDEPVEQHTSDPIDWDIFTDEMLRKITG